MTRIHLTYNKLYLVATNEEKSSSFRVTPRDSYGRPGEISFSGNFPLGNGVDTYSTLVLDDENWDRWFSKREKLDGFHTAAEAAETLVRNFPSISYGCPLCIYRSKNLEDARNHIDEHINKYVSQFDVTVDEPFVVEEAVDPPKEEIPMRRTKRAYHKAQRLTPDMLSTEA